MKRTIRLSENKLHNIIKESVKRILRENAMKLNEYGDTPKGQYMLGRLQARKGSETWAPSWEASEERDNAAIEAEKQGKSYNITHNNMLRAYRDGKNGVQWNESLNRFIKESVKRILREYQFDNDIDYTSIYEQALDLLSGGGEPSGYGWRDVAEAMGFRLDSLGPNDMETMQDAIEDAMMETSGFANEARFRNFVKESVKRVLKETYQEKLGHLTDCLDYYSNIKNDGGELSEDQLNHVEEILSFLNDTNAHDNYDVMNYWIPLANNLLNGSDPEEGLPNVRR